MWLFSLAAYGADALVDGYHLKPASAVVKVGGTVKLNLVDCIVTSNLPPVLKCEGEEGDGDVLAPLVPLDVQWQVVDGQGRVSADKGGATYHAPASKPTPNRATVAVTFKYPLESGGKRYPKAKQTLLSRVTILDEVKSYTGTFSMHDVAVNSEYTTNLNGNIRWEFDEYYEEGQWREYVGKGTAAISVERKSCGGPVGFTNVPVEGRLKVYDDKRYEFLINLVSDEEIKRTCRRHKVKWEEPFSPGGAAMNSADPCGEREFYPRYTDKLTLSAGRNGSCAHNVRNRYQEGWSFKAVE